MYALNFQAPNLVIEPKNLIWDFKSMCLEWKPHAWIPILEHLQQCSVCDSKQYKFIVKNSKCVGLVQEIGFSAPNSCSLLWLVNDTTQLCTFDK
jgi:hypothetical protein